MMKGKNFGKTFLFIILGLLTIIGAYYFYQLFLLPQTVKLPFPEQPPAYSVSYLYSVKSASPTTFIFGEEEVGAANLGRVIEQDLKNIKAAGFTGVKLSFNFKANNYFSERMALKAAGLGLYPIGLLSGHNFKPPNRAFTPNELKEWEEFVKGEVRTNKNYIYFWEVWNEPNMTELKFRYGTPKEYLELLKKTQAIIKTENPAAKIIVTADYTDAQAEVFSNEFLNLGGADYFDYLSFHPYNALNPNSRYNLDQTLNQEKELSRKYHKPLMISEIGFPDSDGGEAKQAEEAQKLFQAAFKNNIPIVWFHWSDRRVPIIDGKTGWGLIRKDNSSKSALLKIREFINLTNKDK